MKKPVSSTNRKSGFTRFISLAAVILIAAVFISAFPTVGTRAESNSFFGLADLFGWQQPAQSTLKSDDNRAPNAGGVCDIGGNIEVEGTGGTNASYATLGAAFAAINAGTHTGAVTIDVCANTTETAATVLNSSGAGSASYTSILMRPGVDGVTISGPTVTGRGLIELNGADNVTIDGDNPNTAGINRNLTITNTAVNTVTYAMAIRIAAYTSVITSADNNIIRNLIVNGNATAQNVSTATSTTASVNISYGIYAGATGTAAPASATTAPSAIASTTTALGSGGTISNLILDNNAVNAAGRAVAVQGSAATVATGLQITNNFIGAATVGSTTNVYSMGITAQGSNNGVIRGNTVNNVESYIAANIRAIDIGAIATVTGDAFTIERNIAANVINRSTSAYGAYGIQIGSGTASTVQNNFIYGLNAVQSNNAYNILYGPRGIRISGGTNHKIYHNSVNLYGALLGTASDVSAGLTITAATLTGIDVRNNIFVNTQTGTSTSTVTAVQLPSGATSSFNLTLNNNDYYNGATPTAYQFILSTVTSSAVTTNYTAANFNAAAITPATNSRSYTSTLSTAGTNDNASKVVDPLFVSNTDLHIATNSPMVDAGATVNVLQDIDGQNRVPPPDIGADEPSGTTPVANDVAATAFINPTNGGTVSAGTAFAPQASFTNNGTATQTNVPVRYQILDAGTNIICNVTGTISSITANQTVTVTFPTCTIPIGGTYTIRATSELVGDQNAANNTITGTITALAPLSGNYNVGTGQTYTTLTAAVNALNGAGVSGPVTLTLTNATYSGSETFPITVNVINGASATNTITIKPATGVSPTISGASASCVINLNGADYVTIDGSNTTNGTSRDLTITNTSTAATTATICMSSLGTGAGATFDTVKNTNISTGTSAAITYAVSIGGSAVATTGADNDNDTIQNNAITVAAVGVNAFGTAAVSAGGMDNLSVTGNSVSNSVSTTTLGIRAGNGLNGSISQNALSIQTSASTAPVGISLETGFVSSTVARNNITKVMTSATGGYGGRGITVGTGTATSNTTIANNFVSGVNGSDYTAFDNSSSFGIGIGVIGNTSTITTTTGGVNLYYNSVNMYGTSVYTTGPTLTAALYVGSGASALDVRDNAFANSIANTVTTGKSYAIYSAAANTAFTTIDYNDYYVSGTQGVLGFITSDRTDLAGIQTGFGQNTNSKNVNPLFTSNSDLHLQTTSTLIDGGTATALVANDIDGQTRPTGAATDIGADEAVATTGNVQFSSATYSVTEAATTATITVTRTGGTLGAASVNYATGDGTATGSTSCGGTVDYVSAAGTLNWADGDAASKTFTVTVCNDGVSESNETVNLTLSGATGAMLGSPSSAVLTIINSDTFNGTAVNVGTGQTYTSLTNAGGVFEAINSGAITANTTFNIASNLTGETGAVALNQFATGYTLTFKPSGAARTITGTSANGLIKLNGADNVVFDGSLSGGTDRSLTITNSGAGAVIWNASANTTNGATGNTYKNLIVVGGGGTTTSFGIVSSSGTSLGGVAEAANSSNNYLNNAVSAVNYGIALVGVTGNETGSNIVGNDIGSTVTASKLGLVGVFLAQQANAFVTFNNILGVTTATTTTASGIQVGGTQSGVVINRNRIRDIKNTNTGGYGANGIQLSSSSTAANLSVRNNFIYDIAGYGYASGFALGDNGYGIIITAGGGYNVYFNSVNMNTNQTVVGNAAAINVTSGVTTAGAIDLRDNIFANTQTAGTTRYAIYSGAANTVFSAIDYNDYFSAGTALGFIGSERATLTDIQTGFGGNTNSKAVNPQFVAATDLHLQTTSPLIGQGITIAGVTVDIDGETRDNPPEIGADEIASAPAPAITVSATSLADFGSIAVGSSSASQSYTVSGSNLTADIIVTAPSTDFQVSLDNTNFSNSVTVTQTGGTASATIYVRFTPQSPGAKSGNVTNASAGATTQNVAVSGTGVAANTPPSITAVGVTRQAGSPGSVSTIANVNDAESGANGVSVTVVGSSTVNGVTVSSISNSNGTVTANVVAVCGASNASFTLQASDGVLTSTATLNVTVTANTAPTLTYNNASVAFGGSTTINPATGPSDNGSVSSIVVQSTGTYTGTITVNNSTGVVSISNAAPAGSHTITIRATDQCGLTTDATFTLTVGAAPTVSLSVSSNSASEAAATVITVTATLSGGTSPTNQTVTLSTSGTATLNSDYTLAGGNLSGTTLTIPANATSGSTTFTVIDDAVQESTETATLTISNPSSGITLGSPVSQSISIADNDVAPSFTSGNSTTFTIGTMGSFSITTSGSPTPTTITSSGTLPSGVTFVNNGNGTATLSGTPGAGTAGSYPLVFTASNGVSPNATQNFTLNVSAQPVTPMVNLSIAPTSGSEAASTTFTATATVTSPVSGNQTVNFALTSGSAGSGDFTAIPASITILNGQTSGTATFSVVNDTLVEGPETATFTISNPSSGITLGSTVSASVTVIDNDDTTAPTITYTAFANTTSTTNPTLNVTITDNIGVPTTGSLVPRIYYLKNAQPTFTSTACVFVSGNSYSCTIDYAAVGGVTSGNTITYFVVAQDTSGNLASNPSGATGTDVMNLTTAPSAPNLYSIGAAASVPSGTYSNLELGGSTLAGNVTVTQQLVLNGIVNNGSNTLTLGPNATVARTSGYVIGNVTKVFGFPPTFANDGEEGSPVVNAPDGNVAFVYPVGTANGYSPVSADVTSPFNGSSLSVNAKQGTQPRLNSTTTLRRYWTLANSGSITANLTFQYLDDATDVSGNESMYQIIRVEGTTANFYPAGLSSFDRTNNTFTALNVSNFSDWTLGTSLIAPTAADSEISGRITNQNQRGLENVKVTLSGGGLVAPISVRTNAVGYYHFSEIPSGATYIMTVSSKRHTFSQPSQVFTVNGDLTNVDFVGQGQ